MHLRGSGYCGNDGDHARMRVRRLFGSPIFCTRERCADLHVIIVVVVFEGQFFLKNGARHRASVDEKKNRMHRHTNFRRYCRYYGRYYYRIMTVLTIVAMENRMTMYTTFSPSMDARCQALIFLKNRIYFAHRALFV